MSKPHVPTALRQAVRDRAANLCEYCRSRGDCDSGSFNVEHIIPAVEGGPTIAENLAWACDGCNSRKGIATTHKDVATGNVFPLFHPRNSAWNEHFEWSDDGLLILPKTRIGVVTVQRLALNRPELINLRRLMVAGGIHPPHD